MKDQKVRNSNQGFSLIELMVVVAIVGVLAAIVYPMYQDQVRQTNRKIAMADLMAIAQAAERYYTSQTPFSYKDMTAMNLVGFAHSPRDNQVANRAYSIVIDVKPGNQRYTIMATPHGRQVGDGQLWLHQDGTRYWSANPSGDTGSWSY